jgi:hypothetical protein
MEAGEPKVSREKGFTKKIEGILGTTRLGSVLLCLGRERGDKNNSISMNLQAPGQNIFIQLFLTGLAGGWCF